jgi:hypothetical protein
VRSFRPALSPSASCKVRHGLSINDDLQGCLPHKSLTNPDVSIPPPAELLVYWNALSFVERSMPEYKEDLVKLTERAHLGATATFLQSIRRIKKAGKGDKAEEDRADGASSAEVVGSDKPTGLKSSIQSRQSSGGGPDLS